MADRCTERLAEVLEEKVAPEFIQGVITSARLLREEICGPVPKRLEHTGADGAPISFALDLTPGSLPPLEVAALPGEADPDAK